MNIEQREHRDRINNAKLVAGIMAAAGSIWCALTFVAATLASVENGEFPVWPAAGETTITIIIAIAAAAAAAAASYLINKFGRATEPRRTAEPPEKTDREQEVHD